MGNQRPINGILRFIYWAIYIYSDCYSGNNLMRGELLRTENHLYLEDRLFDDLMVVLILL